MAELNEELKKLDSDPLVKKHRTESYNSLNQTSSEKPKSQAQPIVTGKKPEQKTGLAKFAEDCKLKENAKNIGSYALNDVVLPAIKRSISDIICNGINMLLYGTAAPKGQNKGQSSYNYNSIYSGQSVYSKAPYRSYNPQQSSRIAGSFVEIPEASSVDACTMQDKILMYISESGSCTVLDYYQSHDTNVTGITGEWTDQSWGWDDRDYEKLCGLKPQMVKDGWILRLPTPHHIKQQ